jgi:hypothetical protein
MTKLMQQHKLQAMPGLLFGEGQENLKKFSTVTSHHTWRITVLLTVYEVDPGHLYPY